MVRPRSREKDEQILLAATALFAEHGYPLVAVADIAARAGVGLSTLYLRFSSKEALGNAVYQHCKRTWARSTLDKVPAGAPPADQFRAYWDHLHRFAKTHRDEASYAERRPAGHALDAETTALLEELHARSTRLVDSWTVSSADPLSHEVVAALIHGTFWQIYALPVPARRRATLLRQARDTIWNAITHQQHP
ncbi:MAG: TetR/AcrR family transcriptional regulator [Actinophytocola sp.]|uniref:TetR/AcrR family transcriptional regulator n=1 Tax=Actinophytocola sp. TaxID=1872138 RepID=UPI003D6A4C76